MAAPSKADTQKRLAKAEEELSQVNDRLKEIEERDNAALQEMHEKLTGEIENKLSSYQDSFKQNFDSRMSDMAVRYSDHIKSHTSNKSHDVLRANRVIRETSRELGEDWKFVFRYLMTTFDKEEVDAEIKRIETMVKPFMQPYEALNIWRDLKGDEFDIQQLLTALRDHAHHELADRASHILQMNKDQLMSMGPIGGGFKNSRPRKEANGEEGDQQSESNNNSYTPYVDVVPDRVLLKLSKKLGPTWKDVGRHLNVDADEMENIQRVEGDTYHGAFKMLFSWRCVAPYTEEAKDILCAALKKAGHGELTEIVTAK